MKKKQGYFDGQPTLSWNAEGGFVIAGIGRPHRRLRKGRDLGRDLVLMSPISLFSLAL
jgi:hypothetical protein